MRLRRTTLRVREQDRTAIRIHFVIVANDAGAKP